METAGRICLRKQWIWHIGSSTSKYFGQRYQRHAKAYDIPGFTVDGNDVLSIDEVVKDAIDRARTGQGPTLIECRTYRWMGHWIGDPQVYRTKEEVDEWKLKCPIKRFREYLISNDMFTAGELDAMEEEAARCVEEAGKFAMDSSEPDPATVMDDVFFEN